MNYKKILFLMSLLSYAQGAYAASKYKKVAPEQVSASAPEARAVAWVGEVEMSEKGAEALASFRKRGCQAASVEDVKSVENYDDVVDYRVASMASDRGEDDISSNGAVVEDGESKGDDADGGGCALFDLDGITSDYLRKFTKDMREVEEILLLIGQFFNDIDPFLTDHSRPVLKGETYDHPLLMCKLIKAFYRFKDADVGNYLSVKDKTKIAYEAVIKDVLLNHARGDVTKLQFIYVLGCEPTPEWVEKHPYTRYIVKGFEYKWTAIPEEGEVLGPVWDEEPQERLVIRKKIVFSHQIWKERGVKHPFGVPLDSLHGTETRYEEDSILI